MDKIFKPLLKSLTPPPPKFQCCKAVRGHGPSGQNKSNPKIKTAERDSKNGDPYLEMGKRDMVFL